MRSTTAFGEAFVHLFNEHYPWRIRLTRQAAPHPQIEWDARLRTDLEKILEIALEEDLQGSDDITSSALVPPTAKARAQVVCREAGVVAGLNAGPILLELMNSAAEWQPLLNDGASVQTGSVIADIQGPAKEILIAERTLLNTIGHLSGVASLTSRFVECVQGNETHICDTRKTIPGWRRLEKYAVRCGGGTNHRMGLYDAILIKDNHLAFGRLAEDGFTIGQAIEQARLLTDTVGSDTIVQVEVDTLEQLASALVAQPDIVLLDNMSPEDLKAAVEMRDRQAPDVNLEASGGVRLETVAQIAATGVDRISVGALTHSARQLDVGLDWCERS